MAEEQDSSIAENESPLTRPSFLLSAVLVLVLVALGVFIAVRVARSDNATTPPPASTAPQPPSAAASTTPADPAASVCGLPGTLSSHPLASPPAVTWDYQGTIAYPKSPEFGPGKTAPEGYRYCFQHSPAGAVVMAANALAQGSDSAIGSEWAEYALAKGPYRDQLVDQVGTVTGSEGTRLKIAGFRVLSYDGRSARVDLGVRGSSQSQELVVSGVYELTWQQGDWKISTDVRQPLDIATIPDLAGYIPWGE